MLRICWQQGSFKEIPKKFILTIRKKELEFQEHMSKECLENLTHRGLLSAREMWEWGAIEYV